MENTNNLIISNSACEKRVVYISDLHFDYVKDTAQRSGHCYAPESACQCQADFIDYVKANYKDDILCLAGDFYDDAQKTLEFIKEMENNNILGFFVLGNHDYWSNGLFGYEDIISKFIKETSTHNWFRYLRVGKKYYINDLCFIGDTGWTSFSRGSGHQVELKQFMLLPDAINVRNFDPERIIEFHNKWIDFANDILTREKKVVVLTHFPMIDLTRNNYDCWWSSQTRLINSENQWRIFGHIHAKRYGANYNLTCQRGYENKEISKLYMLNEQDLFNDVRSQYQSKDFDFLYKANESREIKVIIHNLMANYYLHLLPEQINESTQLCELIEHRGYKRSAANKVNFAYLAYKKDKYLKKVRKEIDSFVGMCKKRIGYCHNSEINQDIIDTLNVAANYLENNEVGNDVRTFITAAILTGYAWNKEIFQIENMRPVNDYDILRYYLQLITMKKYNIKFNGIQTIKRSKKDKITFGNIKIWLPRINGMQLSIEQAMFELNSISLLENIESEI